MKYVLLLVFVATMAACSWKDACKFKEYLPDSAGEYICKDTPTVTPTPTESPTQSPTITPTPATVSYYTVTEGQNVEQECKVPCTLSFDITNFSHTEGEDGLEEHFAWAYNVDWSGGNPKDGSYAASFRDYKLKLYGVGAYAGEKRLYASFDSAKTYHLEFYIDKKFTAMTIYNNNEVLSTATVDGDAPDTVKIGYGWPPTQRNGAAGAKLSNIKLTNEETL